MSYAKPLPASDDLSRPFWDAAKRGELRLPRCGSCGAYRTYFEKWCASCGHDRFAWALLSGRGIVWSHCAFHRAYFPGFADELPYNVALVELAEGPRLVTNIVGIERERIAIGMPVEVFFDDVTPELTLMKFQPVRGDTGSSR
jgi:uncharacterized OB-fold protein